MLVSLLGKWILKFLNTLLSKVPFLDCIQFNCRLLDVLCFFHMIYNIGRLTYICCVWMRIHIRLPKALIFYRQPLVMVLFTPAFCSLNLYFIWTNLVNCIITFEQWLMCGVDDLLPRTHHKTKHTRHFFTAKRPYFQWSQRKCRKKSNIFRFDFRHVGLKFLLKWRINLILVLHEMEPYYENCLAFQRVHSRKQIEPRCWSTNRHWIW